MKARDVIAPALQMISVGSREQPADAGDMQTALERLNAILLDWTTRLYIGVGPTFTSLTLTPGQTAYTLGPSGDLVLPRAPLALLDATLNDMAGAPSTTLDILPYAVLRAQAEPTGYGTPQMAAFQRGSPDSLLLLSPEPTYTPTYALAMALDLGLPTFPDYDTDVPTMPAWYLLCLQSNLAVAVASDFGRPVPAFVGTTAQRTLAHVTSQASANSIPYATIDPAIPGQ